VHRTDSGIRLSATDLSHFLSCRHLTALDLAAVHKLRARPHRPDDPLLELLWKRGLEHEKAFVEALRREGRAVLDLNDIPRNDAERAIEQTCEAIRAGVDVIVQAALRHESWFGYADVLVRREVPSSLGPWSYEVIDTKLARETRAGTVLQLGLYTAMLAELQGATPEQFHVVIPAPGGLTQISIPFRVDDYAAYMRLMQRELVRSTHMDPDELAQLHYPDPVEHCDICGWRVTCDRKRHEDDHLSLVAGLGRMHRRELSANSITTLASFAALPEQLPFRPKRGSKDTYARYRQQALVQLQSRMQETILYSLRPAEPPPRDPAQPVEPRGLSRMPAPSPGDVFLDLEGDTYADEGGREYLFGIALVEADGTVDYRKWWAFTAAEEREAFESVMDFIMDRLERHPDMHIYHFAHYEPTAFKKLMGRHATRERELDRLLRGGRFIDLLGVVRQSMWAGVESYSIKRLEPLYQFKRDVNLPDAGHSLRRMEYALQVRQPTLVLDADREIILGYNRDDCVSTLRLRDWLEQVRTEAESQGIPCPRPPFEPDVPPERVTERDLAVRELRAELLRDVPDESRTAEQHATWLLAFLLDYHRREDKATWWEYFRLRELSDEELLDERQAVSGLQFVERVDDGERSEVRKRRTGVIDRYSYPEQDMDIDRGANLMQTDGKDFAKVDSVNRAKQTIDIYKSRGKAEVHPTALIQFEYIRVEEIEDSLMRLGQAAANAGLRALSPSAAVALLLGNPPRLRSGSFIKTPDESEVDFAIRTVRNLDRSVLAIQGPPGAGKTYTGAHIIAALVADGKRVGVTANSHKVIRKLLDEASKVARKAGIPLRAAHKDGMSSEESNQDPVFSVPSNEAGFDALTSGEAQVLGGTAWLWAREEFANSIDVLLVDEAGQMSLANVLAVSQSANSIVLLGDPQQLDQPTQGSHPDGVAVSALQHMLGSDKTIPEDRGIFLPTTWRMAPSLCAFSSELYYERRLFSKHGLEHQALQNAGDLSSAGLWYVDVSHDGNRNHSPEELDVIVKLVERLTRPGVTWTDENSNAKQVGISDILVVSPYNTQVNRLTEKLPEGARVGTVDKFQGQQAPVVIYSMATSRPKDAPRGMEFLYSPNRLNVATSRAQCAVILVASPHLFQPECRSVRQIKLANGLCRFREMANALALP
jgi:predicted RecB family nuclease